MKVIYDIGNLRQYKNLKQSVLVLGVFDGVHRGHQALIKKAIQKAKLLGCKIIVLTFDPHPVHVLQPTIYLPLIVPVSSRLKLFEKLGVDACVVIKFTKEFSKLTPVQFIQKYLVKPFFPREIFVGDDFRFGENRTGTLDSFKGEGKRHCFKVNGLRPVLGNKHKISSSTIRQLVLEGDLKKAAAYLGRPVSVAGEVVQGNRRGTSLGYPTANVHYENELLPPSGVYAVHVYLKDRKYKGVANLGIRPTFAGKDQHIILEVHIFSFHKNIYGHQLTVEFIERIRDEKAFNSIPELISQIKSDGRKAKIILGR